MSNSSFDSADSDASAVSSRLRLSDSEEELECDAVATELSEQNVAPYEFEPAASGASSSASETVGTDA